MPAGQEYFGSAINGTKASVNPSSQTPADRAPLSGVIGWSGGEWKAPVLTAATLGLYAPLWWFRVRRALRDLSTTYGPPLSHKTGTRSSWWAALAIALFVVSLLTLTASLIWEGLDETGAGDALGAAALLLFAPALIVTVVSLFRGASTLRAVENEVGAPLTSRLLMTLLLVLGVVTPFAALALIGYLQQHLTNLGEASDDADVSSGGYLAWSAWSVWRGDRSLLARVARAALFAVSTHEPEVTSRIEVRALGDNEIFTTPAEFAADATSEAVRRFDVMRVHAEGTRLAVIVGFIRRASEDVKRFTPSAAFVEVVGENGAHDDVLKARGVVAAALNRGRMPLLTHVASGSGLSARPRLAQYCAARETAWFRVIFGAFILTIFFVAGVVVQSIFYWSFGWFDFVLLLAVPIVGGGGALLCEQWLLPPLAVAETRTRLFALRAAKVLAPALASSVVAAAIKHWLPA